MKFAVLLLSLSLVFATPLVAEAQPATVSLIKAKAEPFDPAAATRAWLDTVPAEKRARSDAYFEGGYWLILWNFLLGVAIALLLLGTGLSEWLRDFAERTPRFKSLQVAIYAASYTGIVFLLSFPLSIYADYFREHSYGLATQSFGLWFREQLIGLVIGVIGSVLGLIVLYAVFRRAPRSWWLWGTAVGVFFFALSTMIAPVFIAPLFNTYKPLADPKISQPILAMAAANEIPVHEVFEVDASRQTNRVSANVSGLFGTTRISLNDNLLKRCTLPEIRAVMAHEMGHYILNHSFKLMLYLGLFVFGGFAFCKLTFDRAVRRWGEHWGLRGLADPAGFPLLVLLFSIFFFLITPLYNTAIRVTEREADAFGINTAREADGFAKVSLKLGDYRKLDPGPIEEMIFFDHPSGRARIRMAMDWKAANLPPGDAGTPTEVLSR
jgi:Zn-dependent protease with chaperone function